MLTEGDSTDYYSDGDIMLQKIVASCTIANSRILMPTFDVHYGDWCVLAGDNKTCVGNKNLLFGDDWHAIGDDNLVVGDRPTFYGKRNRHEPYTPNWEKFASLHMTRLKSHVFSRSREHQRWNIRNAYMADQSQGDDDSAPLDDAEIKKQEIELKEEVERLLNSVTGGDDSFKETRERLEATLNSASMSIKNGHNFDVAACVVSTKKGTDVTEKRGAGSISHIVTTNEEIKVTRVSPKKDRFVYSGIVYETRTEDEDEKEQKRKRRKKE